MGQLDDKTAVVTGASTGIGAAIARAFAAEGASVVLASRNAERLEQVAAEIGAAGGSARVVPTDVTDEDQVVALFDHIRGALGRLDILVNNAGINAPQATDEMSLATWQRVVDTNLTGPFLCGREAMKLMKPQGGGRIINIGSVSAKVPRPNSAPYTATKFGLEGLTRSMALDGRAHGIAVSVLHPGNVFTAIWEGREEVAAREGVIQPDDLARVVVAMAALPPDVNLLEGIILPVTMPFLGRG